MLSKKANVMISFSWIFMIIIGGFFLILSYNIISKYQDNQEAKYDIELRQALRSILNNAGRTSGIEENSLENAGNLFNGKSAEVMCIDTFPTLWIDDGKITDSENQFIENYPLFMSRISASKTDDAYIAVESFRLPFKITNMVAIVSEKNLIVFDKDSEITKKYLYKFNKGSYRNLEYKADWNFDTDFQSILDYAKERNIESIVFVSDRKTSTPNPITVTQLNQFKKIAYLVEIEEKETKGKYGTIYYLDKDGVTSSYDYIDYDNSLGVITMAVFSTPKTFECSYNQILNSIPEVYDFYITKTTYLYGISKNSQICSSSLISYGSADIGWQQQFYYQNLNTSLSNFKKNIALDDGNSQIVNFNNTQNIYNLLTLIETDFKNLEKYNCPYVY